MRGPLRVGILCPYTLAVPGGVQTHVLALASALEADGVRADVIAPTDDADAGEFEVVVRSLGASVPVPTNGSTARIALGPTTAWRAMRIAEDYDVLHVHEPLVPGAALMTSARAKRPRIGTFHAASDGYWGYRIGRPLLQLAWDGLSMRTAVSDAAIGRVRPYFDGAVDVEPNGVDVDGFASAAPLSDPNGRDSRVVLFIGRDEPRKGLPVLRRAFVAVRDALPDAELWIAGPGTGSQRGDGIRAFDRVDTPTLRSLYRSADVFCAPARFGESFGVVLLEAMSAGAAVVATDIEGYAAVARDGQEAVLVAPDDVDALASALVEVCTDDTRRSELVAAGARRARDFDWTHLAARMRERYERVLS